MIVKKCGIEASEKNTSADDFITSYLEKKHDFLNSLKD